MPQDQPQAESISDRVAAKFGLTDEPQAPQAEQVEQPEGEAAPQGEQVETQEATDAAPETTADDFVEIETDEGKFQIPKALEPAVLRQKDYTQKTQKLAEREKQWDVLVERNNAHAIRAQFETENAQALQQLQAFDSVLNQQVDWSQVPDADVPRTLAQRQSWKEQRDQLANQVSAKYQEFNAKQTQALEGVRAKTREANAKAIPNYNDATAKELRDHAKTYGYSEAELAAMDFDPRHAPLLYKAMQYDKLMASKAKAVQTAKAAPPMVKPGSTRPMPQDVKNDLALRKAQASAKTSSERAKIIQQRLEGRFR